MKTITFILTTLLALGSTSAFAEGGAERMRYYYDNFPVQHAQSEQRPTPVREKFASLLTRRRR